MKDTRRESLHQPQPDSGRKHMLFRFSPSVLLLAILLCVRTAYAQVVKFGVVVPLTGEFAEWSEGQKGEIQTENNSRWTRTILFFNNSLASEMPPVFSYQENTAFHESIGVLIVAGLLHKSSSWSPLEKFQARNCHLASELDGRDCINHQRLLVSGWISEAVSCIVATQSS